MTGTRPRAERIIDRMDPARAAALHATLGRMGPPPAEGQALPPFWHHIHFWAPQPPEALGRDGHPRVGQGLIPELGLPQRMWAGGRLEFHHPLVLGTPAERISVLEAVSEKQGRSGRLGFVTLRHEFRQEGRLCLVEWQDLVYREPVQARRAGPPPPQAPRDEVTRIERAFDAVTLFRYSALTFNGHRIHYDADYCREVEGYPGLVVHGPLLAQMLIDLASREAGPLAAFRFRATAPLFAGERVAFCRAADGGLWARGPDGRLCMTAEAVTAA
ncbi:acyl dehydratase [Meinhardsimonia xiamenensis]|jgi:3-methylfumaryl-CoA hydratase|nr:acyl dehydratase [Meinhardsimonia xiamenensis]